ncbi:MAG TPA: hypothetical protein VF141_21525, partial [Chryseolinea sp.]
SIGKTQKSRVSYWIQRKGIPYPITTAALWRANSKVTKNSVPIVEMTCSPINDGTQYSQTSNKSIEAGDRY